MPWRPAWLVPVSPSREWVSILIVPKLDRSLDFISGSLLFQVSFLLFLSTQMVHSSWPLTSDLDFPVGALKEVF